MNLYICKFDYQTLERRGWGEVVVMAPNEDVAMKMAQMACGAGSDYSDAHVRRVPDCAVIVSDKSVSIQERDLDEKRNRSMIPRQLFTVAGKATVTAKDKFEAYKKLGNMLGQTPAPNGLKRKVVEQTPISDMSRRDENEIFKETRFLSGGAARPK